MATYYLPSWVDYFQLAIGVTKTGACCHLVDMLSFEYEQYLKRTNGHLYSGIHPPLDVHPGWFAWTCCWMVF